MKKIHGNGKQRGTVNVRIARALWRRLKIEAARRGVSLEAVLRDRLGGSASNAG